MDIPLEPDGPPLLSLQAEIPEAMEGLEAAAPTSVETYPEPLENQAMQGIFLSPSPEIFVEVRARDQSTASIDEILLDHPGFSGRDSAIDVDSQRQLEDLHQSRQSQATEAERHTHAFGQTTTPETDMELQLITGILGHNKTTSDSRTEVSSDLDEDIEMTPALDLIDILPVHQVNTKDLPIDTIESSVSLTRSSEVFVKMESVYKKAPSQDPDTFHEDMDLIPEYTPTNYIWEAELSYDNGLFVSDTEQTPIGRLSKKVHGSPKNAKSAKDSHKQRGRHNMPKQKAVPIGRNPKLKSKNGGPKSPLNIMKSLMNGNALREQDTDDDDDDEDEPSPFTTRHKKDLLKELLDRCPKNSDSRANRFDVNTLDAATKMFRKGQIISNHLQDRRFFQRGMTSSLYAHQLLGAGVMVGWEKAANGPDEGKSMNGYHGGICADAMGLGKTVLTLAVMTHNKPERKAKLRTTLIILPSTMIAQWREEIKRHATSAFPAVMVYESKKDEDIGVITRCDVVLTSYNEVFRSCPYPDAATRKAFKKESQERARRLGAGKKVPAEDDDSNDLEDWVKDNLKSGRRPAGALHTIEWYRIVLDEAHLIKNRRSRTSLAVNALKGMYRLALTGTPIMNSLSELYPYFRFFKDQNSKSFRMFKAYYLNRKTDLNRERLSEALSKMMIMYVQINTFIRSKTATDLFNGRSINDKFLGRPLIKLPTPHEVVVKIDFNPSELILYRAVEGRIRKAINAVLRQAGDQQESSEGDSSDDDQNGDQAKILALITFLRHMTAHPLLIEKYVTRVFSLRKLEGVRSAIFALANPDIGLCSHIDAWLEIVRQRGEQTVDIMPEDSNSPICGICDELVQEPLSLPTCTDTFCRSCIEEYEIVEVSKGAVEPSCPICQKPFDLGPMKDARDIERKARAAERRIRAAKDEKLPKNGKDTTGFIPRIKEPYKWLQSVDASEEILCKSAKSKAIMDQILSWLCDAPEEKFILFTQWLPFATILGRELKENNVEFVYFTGDLSLPNRVKAIDKFSKEPSIKVMIATLKTAGVGLNLAFASRVISVDPWWNDCLERQAFGRVYRIGQTRETYFVKYIVNDSVDSRIVDLQEQKREMIDRIQGTKVKTTMAEIIGMVGRVVTGDDGRIRVQADHDDTDISDSEEDSDDESNSDSESDSSSESGDDYDERFDGPR